MRTSWYSDLPKFYQRKIEAAGLADLGRAKAETDRPLGRRQVLKTAGAAVGVLSVGSFMRPAAAASQMDYMCWEGYNDPRIVAPFAEANDVDIAFDLIVDSPGGFAKLLAGASRDIDLVSSDMPWITRMGPAGLAEYLDDADYADVYASFYPQFKPPFEPLLHDGNTIGVATRWGWVGPSLNTDVMKPEAWKTYDPVFDPKNQGKIAFMDWGDWPILPMALHAGIDPYQELDEKALEEVRKVLRAAFKHKPVIVGDLTLAQKGLLDGSLLGLIGGGSYITSALRKHGHKNIMAIVPDMKDGLKQGIIWVEATAIVKDTDEPELSRKLLKHMVSPEVGIILSLLDTTCNVVTNAQVETLYTEEQKSILQTDYMWHAWDNSNIHRIAPNIDEMLQIWQEELVAAQ